MAKDFWFENEEWLRIQSLEVSAQLEIDKLRFQLDQALTAKIWYEQIFRILLDREDLRPSILEAIKQTAPNN